MPAGSAICCCAPADPTGAALFLSHSAISARDPWRSQRDRCETSSSHFQCRLAAGRLVADLDARKMPTATQVRTRPESRISFRLNAPETRRLS